MGKRKEASVDDALREALLRKRKTKTDFEYRRGIQYSVTGGAWVMDYRTVPTLRWVGR